MSLEKCAPMLHQKVLLLRWCIAFCVLISLSKSVQGMRAKRAPNFLDAAIHTEYVDRNNDTILKMFNLTQERLRNLLDSRNASNKVSPEQTRDSDLNAARAYREFVVRAQIQTAIENTSTQPTRDQPQHEMAAYPICNAESNENSWLQDNNVTIQFSDSLFEPKRDNLNLDSATLRLYKINPNGTNEPVDDELESQKPKRCADEVLDSQIRVTVSLIQQIRRNRRERKKRICNTIMMNVSKTGWVEIDIKRAIQIWENAERQPHMQQLPQARQAVLVGWLMIEVHDEEERPLKPGLFFKAPKCDQADFAIPWNYYGPHRSMSPFAAFEVPRYPRLDVKLIGYASFVPRNYNKQQTQKLKETLQHQLFNSPKHSAESSSESTTSVTPTANNLLEADTYTLDATAATGTFDVPHNHRKRHSRHHYQQMQQLNADSQERKDDSSSQPNYSSSTEHHNEAQHKHNRCSPHRSHRHQRRHHQQQQNFEKVQSQHHLDA